MVFSRPCRLSEKDHGEAPDITYNLLENTSVQHSLGPSALPLLLVVLLETVVVCSELLEAVGVDVL